MTLPKAIVITMALSATVVACSDDPSPTEQACDGWRELLLEEPAPSDAEVVERLGELLELGPDEPVAGYMTAVRARLRDGVDISTSYKGLSDACL